MVGKALRPHEGVLSVMPHCRDEQGLLEHEFILVFHREFMHYDWCYDLLL
jgi:hypothetical protein